MKFVIACILIRPSSFLYMPVLEHVCTSLLFFGFLILPKSTDPLSYYLINYP